MAHVNTMGGAESLPDLTAMPAAARRFVRGAHLDPGYSVARHIALTLTAAALIAGLGALLARHARALDWLMAPAFFVVANFIEWVVHRYPLHRPMPPRFAYRSHTLMHHLAFTDVNMPIVRPSELGLVMVPWHTMIGFLLLASPVMALAGVLRGPGLAGVFVMAAVAYFLMYELLHALYHLPGAALDRAGIGRSRLFRRALAHHRRHHALEQMSRVNFNVTFPLMDYLMRTREP